MRKSKVNKCKCCYSALGVGPSHLIFDEAGKRQNIAFLLFDYIGRTVYESNGDQQAVCDNCLRQLVQSFEFKQRCLRTVGSDDSDDEEEEEIVEEYNETVDDNLTLNEFDQYVEFIDDCGEQADGGEDEEVDGDGTSAEHMVDGAEYEYLNEAIEFEPVKEELQSLTTSEVEYLDPELDDDDDGNYTNANVEESAARERDIIELTEYALDTTSKTVKTIDTIEDLHRVKEQLKQGIPRHMVRDDADVFKIPKMQSCEQIEYLEEEDSQVCIDEYLKSIALIGYVENYGSEFSCKLCSETLTSHQHMLHHSAQLHRTKDMSVCIFDKKCPVFGETQKLQDHIFNEHFDSLPTKLFLMCSTCENVFDSVVQFGKHLCQVPTMMEDETKGFYCDDCDKTLTSRNRFLFHRQFHLKKARPKVCIVCELTFSEEERFYNHVMFSHETVFEHFCDFCDKSFSASQQLDRHIRTHTMSRPPTTCTKCEQTFDDKETLVEHICERQPGEKASMCPVCKKVYKRPSRLRKHMTTHDSVVVTSVLTCEFCSLIFGNETVAVDHCHRDHDDDLDLIGSRTLSFALCCEFCEDAYYDHLKLVEHKQKHHSDSKPFKCEFCMAKYDTYSKLKTHRNSHASQIVDFPVQRHYMCDRTNCWKKYRHWSDLLNHRKTVHLINPSIFKCTDCEKTFYQSWKYDYHKKTQHGQSYTCDECNTLFNSIILYKSHVKKHHSNANTSTTTTSAAPETKTVRKKPQAATDIDQYLRIENDQMFCTECEKTMTTRNAARTHIEMVHLKIRKFTCEMCDKEFYLKKDFNDHTRIHTAETPFPCTMCDKRFRTTSMLNEHRKFHTNERKYKCPYCVAAFKRAYVLKNHIKQHIGVKEFACPAENCDKEYRTQWELNFHCRKKHSPDTPKQFACCYNDCGLEFATHNELTVHYESIHASTDKNTKRKSKPKRTGSGSRGATTSKSKIIYVMPGRVEKTADEDAEAQAEHNYPATKRKKIAKESYQPQFVYVVDAKVKGKRTKPSAVDLGACQDIDDESRTIIM